MKLEAKGFGTITIDGVTYDHDVVIDGGQVRKRDKKPSKPHRAEYRHTPLSAAEVAGVPTPAVSQYSPSS